MTDLDDRVRILLEERAREHVVDPQLPRAVAVRSRRRRALVGTGAGLGAVAAIVLGAAALRLLDTGRETGITPSPTPVVETWHGIWPQATHEEAEAAQAAADAGDVEATWQLDATEVVTRFAQEELVFDEVFFDESLDIAEPDSPGPYTIHVISCEPRDTIEWPPVCVGGEGLYAEATIERLLRADRTGIWSVTAASPVVSTASESPPPSPHPGVGYPDTFVGLTNGGDLVVARLSDGTVVRTLLEGGADAGGLDLTLGPGAIDASGEHVYVTDWSGKNPRILRVATDGSQVLEAATGSSPTIGPDGRFAYAGCGVEQCGTDLMVELQGEMVRLEVSASGEERVGALTWLPDGRIAFSIAYLGDSNADVRILDPDAPPRYLLDLEPIGPANAESGWTAIGWHRGTESLAVDSYCCTGYAGDPIEDEAVLPVDPDTGEAGPSIVDGAGVRVALDRTGRWFLLIRVSPDGLGRELLVLERNGDRRPIGDGFRWVAW